MNSTNRHPRLSGRLPPRAMTGSMIRAVREPMFLLDRFGRVLRMNAAAQAFLAEDNGLACVGGYLQADMGQLADAIAAVSGGGDGLLRSRHVLLERGAERVPAALLLMPWREQPARVARHHPAVLALAYELAVPAPDYASRFRLTASEAIVADDLLDGLRLRDIAERRNRSLSTIRTHVASLMSKTQTSRQADLVRCLMRA